MSRRKALWSYKATGQLPDEVEEDIGTLTSCFILSIRSLLSRKPQRCMILLQLPYNHALSPRNDYVEYFHDPFFQIFNGSSVLTRESKAFRTTIEFFQSLFIPPPLPFLFTVFCVGERGNGRVKYLLFHELLGLFKITTLIVTRSGMLFVCLSVSAITHRQRLTATGFCLSVGCICKHTVVLNETLEEESGGGMDEDQYM